MLEHVLMSRYMNDQPAEGRQMRSDVSDALKHFTTMFTVKDIMTASRGLFARKTPRMPQQFRRLTRISA